MYYATIIAIGSMLGVFLFLLGCTIAVWKQHPVEIEEEEENETDTAANEFDYWMQHGHELGGSD